MLPDELTTVELGNAVRVASGRVKPRVLCCMGKGFMTGMVAGAFVTPCWCTAGLRMVCAVPDDAWPLPLDVARQTAKRLGLKVARGKTWRGHLGK